MNDVALAAKEQVEAIGKCISENSIKWRDFPAPEGVLAFNGVCNSMTLTVAQYPADVDGKMDYVGIVVMSGPFQVIKLTKELAEQAFNNAVERYNV